jgi:CRISPR/Cas system-associated protein Cas10 (large subunit of type III CRISPR-Cas system)
MDNMISELKNEDILDFLMTSEFEDDFKPEELKYFLFKWRYFYRLLHSKFKLSKDEFETLNREKEEILTKYDRIIEELKIKIGEKDAVINKMKSRKLTFKERLKGEIIQKDENNRI